MLYASVHVDPAAGWFPHLVGHADETGAGRGVGCNRNEVVPPGAGDEPWLAALDNLFADVRAFAADALVVSLGVDAAADDPESRCSSRPAVSARPATLRDSTCRPCS